MLDGAGQPTPRPSSPLHEVVGEDAGDVAGDEADGDDGEQPRPRPNNPLQAVVGDDADGWVDVGGRTDEVAGADEEPPRPRPLTTPPRSREDQVGM